MALKMGRNKEAFERWVTGCCCDCGVY